MDPTKKKMENIFLVIHQRVKVHLKLTALKENQCGNRNLNKRKKNLNGKTCFNVKIP